MLIKNTSRPKDGVLFPALLCEAGWPIRTAPFSCDVGVVEGVLCCEEALSWQHWLSKVFPGGEEQGRASWGSLGCKPPAQIELTDICFSTVTELSCVRTMFLLDGFIYM